MFHVIYTDIYDSTHDYNKDRADFVLCNNEGGGSISDDGSDFDDTWMLGFEESLLINPANIFDFHFAENVVVIPGPGKTNDTRCHYE